MGKVVKAIAMIALTVAIAIAAPHLAPAFLVHLIGSTAAIAVTGALLSAASALALSAFSPKPNTSGATPTDIRQSLGVSQIIIGKCRVGAILTFFHPKKSGSSYYRYFVWTVAGHRCSGLATWYLNDQVTYVDGTGKITSGPYKDHGWLWFERGEHAAAPNATFVNECDGRWTNAHVGNEVAKIYAKFEMTDDIVSAGMPNITAEIEGTDEIYDPRDDTTGYTNNGALAFYWWMALPRAEGGFGCYDDEIDWDWVSAQANVCDEDVGVGATRTSTIADAAQGDTRLFLDSVVGLNVGTVITIGAPGQVIDKKTVRSISGGNVGLDSGLPRAYPEHTLVAWADTAGAVTEKRYALDGFLTTGSDPSSVRDVLVANMAGRFTYSGGLMLMRPGYFVPVSMTLSEDDLVAGISYDLLTASDQRVTEVDATWNDPTNLYQQVALPARSTGDADVAQASLDLPFVKSRARAERIQKIKLLQSAAEKTLQWPVNIVGLGVGPMDTIRLATSRYSLDNYAFTVTNWGLASDFSVALTVREENEDMYAWDAGDESDYAVIDRIARADPITAPRASYKFDTKSNSAPTSSDSGSITIAAFSGGLDDGRQVDLPAGAITGLAAGTTYGVFFVAGLVAQAQNEDGSIEENEDGSVSQLEQTPGGYIAQAQPAFDAMADQANIFVGWQTTLNADGTVPTAPPASPGYGGDGTSGQIRLAANVQQQ